MKTFRLFAVIAAFALIFTSCSEDEFSIIGKWNMDKQTTQIYEGTSATGTPISEYVETVDLGWLQFNNGGTGVDDSNVEFTWDLVGDELTITFDDPEDPYVVNVKITSKSSDKIKCYTIETETDDEGTYTYKMILELSKV